MVVVGLTWNRLLMRVDNSAWKGTSGMNKFGSVIDRMNMKLGSKFLYSPRIKTELLKRLQRAIIVDSATHSQKDGMEDNGGSLEDGAEAFVFFLRGAQLVLRSSQYLISMRWMLRCRTLRPLGRCCLGKVDLLFFSFGGWRCCWVAPGLPQLPPATPKISPPFIASLLLFCFRGDWNN